MQEVPQSLNNVIPAKAGIQYGFEENSWTPAFAGVTNIFALVSG